MSGCSDDEWGDEDLAVTKPGPKYEKYEVITDWSSTGHPDDLSLQKWDTVLVFKKEGEWWEGEHQGVYGRFPSHVVRLIKPS